MDIAVARIHPVHVMNCRQRQMAVNPQTKTIDLRCESACRLLPSTTTIAIYICIITLLKRCTRFHIPST